MKTQRRNGGFGAAAGAGFPVTRMLQTLDEIGGLRRLGREVFSAAFDGMSADQLIEVIASTQQRALETAGIRYPR